MFALRGAGAALGLYFVACTLFLLRAVKWAPWLFALESLA